VCVLGKSVASNIFGSRNPLGENIRINKDIFSVIGVMEPLGQTSGGRDQDDIVILPYTTFQKRIVGAENIESISISVGDSEDIEAAKNQILELLRSRHGMNRGEEGAFYIRSQQAAIDRIFTISKIMTILLASVASISLVVGGIGIMNIMLVSVRERTKEIGIRMAVGAKEVDILLQFLLESVMLSLSGGISGVVVGILASVIASFAIKWPVVISPGAILLALFFALIVGVFFGIYPARKASKMEPIDALRFEK
jgi:putative ABC transport system permease protein